MRHPRSSTRRSKTLAQAGPASHPLRLIRLFLELAAAGVEGFTPQEMLARPSIIALYSTNRSASQALRRDLILLSGASSRQHRRAGEIDSGQQEPTGRSPLVRFDLATGRYALARSAGPLHLSSTALEALCMLARALGGGKKVPGGGALFAQLCAALEPEQQTVLQLSLQGQPHSQAAPTLTLDLPEVEEADLATLGLLMRAIRQHQTVSFDYQPSRKDTPTAHRGDEVLEVWIGSHVYVSVWCEEAQRELDLRLDRFVRGSLKMYPRSARRRKRSGERIRYWLAPEIVQGGVNVRLEQPTVTRQPDGSAIVSGIARSRFWAKKLLLAYGSNARALEPATLVAEMRRTAEEMLRNYEDTGRKWEI